MVALGSLVSWVRLSIFFLCLSTFIFFKPAGAEPASEDSNISPEIACQAYLDFLNGETNQNRDDCLPIPGFLSESASFSDFEFFRNYDKMAKGQSALRHLLRVRAAVDTNGPIGVYNVLDLADRLVFSTFQKYNDSDRSMMYATLIVALKIDALSKICRPDAGCEDLLKLFKFERIFGSEFSFLDNMSARDVFVCSLRSDGFIVPIKKVLESARFKNCIAGK